MVTNLYHFQKSLFQIDNCSKSASLKIQKAVSKKKHLRLKNDPLKTKHISLHLKSCICHHFLELANQRHHLLPKCDLCFILTHIVVQTLLCIIEVPPQSPFGLRKLFFSSLLGTSTKKFHYVVCRLYQDNPDEDSNQTSSCMKLIHRYIVRTLSIYMIFLFRNTLNREDSGLIKRMIR